MYLTVMLDRLTALTGAADHFDAVALTGMFAAPVMLSIVAVILMVLA